MGLSVHRQSRSTRLAKRLDAWRNGTAGSTIKQVWISLRCSPPPLSRWLARGRAKMGLMGFCFLFFGKMAYLRSDIFVTKVKSSTGL